VSAFDFMPLGFDASDYERPAKEPRRVAGAFSVNGHAVGVQLTHEPSDALPHAHRLEARAWRPDGLTSHSVSGVWPSFREAWAELLRFVEAEGAAVSAWSRKTCAECGAKLTPRGGRASSRRRVRP